MIYIYIYIKGIESVYKSLGLDEIERCWMIFGARESHSHSIFDQVTMFETYIIKTCNIYYGYVSWKLYCIILYYMCVENDIYHRQHVGSPFIYVDIIIFLYTVISHPHLVVGYCVYT